MVWEASLMGNFIDLFVFELKSMWQAKRRAHQSILSSIKWEKKGNKRSKIPINIEWLLAYVFSQSQYDKIMKYWFSPGIYSSSSYTPHLYQVSRISYHKVSYTLSVAFRIVSIPVPTPSHLFYSVLHCFSLSGWWKAIW